MISNGKLYWIQDAYTTSDYFPYAQPVQRLSLNYIRNSVKIVIDAYNGTVAFYLMDAAEPIARTYQQIFPDLFKPFAAMPPDLQKHIRYPEDLFLFRRRSIKPTTWKQLTFSITARISGNSHVSRAATVQL